MYDAKIENNGTKNAPNAPMPLADPNWLEDEIRARRIPVPPNATPAEVIPWVYKFIKRHLEIGSNIPSNVDSYPAWKALLDDWKQFLQKLENPPKKLPTIPPQPLPTRPESCQKLPDIAKTLPRPCQPLPKPCQTSPTAATQHDAPPQPASNAQNEKSEIPKSKSPPDPQSEIPTPKSEEPPRGELEFADLHDGFATERERLAVARAELQDHLALRPIRLNKLTAREQAAIYALMFESNFSSRAVSKILAEAPPNGMAIRISKTALNHWRKKYEKRLAEEAKQHKSAAELQSATEVLDKSPDPDAAFQAAAERILKLRILTGSEAPDEKLDQLVATLTRLRKQSLAERKQLHAEKSK
jgi:hypothetical protein